MKKFKRKNRIKRKYVRKQSHETSFSQSSLLPFGFIPFILIAIALVTTILIKSAPVITIPAINIHPIKLPFSSEDIKQFTQAIAMKGYLTITQLFQLLAHSLFVSISFSYTKLSELATILEPKPFVHAQMRIEDSLLFNTALMIQALSNLLIHLSVLFGNVVLNTLRVIEEIGRELLAACILTLTGTILEVYQIYLFLLQIISFVLIAIRTSFATAYHVSLDITQQTVKSMTMFEISVSKNVTEWLAKFIYFLETPLRILKYYLVELQPILNFLSNSVKNSAGELSSNLSSLFTFK